MEILVASRVNINRQYYLVLNKMKVCQQVFNSMLTMFKN